MKKVSSHEVMSPSVELALLAETRFRPHPSLFVDLAVKIHDSIGDDESTLVILLLRDHYVWSSHIR